MDSELRRRRNREDDDVAAMILGEDDDSGEETSSLLVTKQPTKSIPVGFRTQRAVVQQQLPDWNLYDSIWELLQDFFTKLWGDTTGSTAPTAPAMDDRSKAALAVFKQNCNIAFDSNNNQATAEVTADIYKLWQLTFPREPAPEPVSQKWTSLGFQGDHPLRDIRGCGLFGMKQILFFAQKYPESFLLCASPDQRESDTKMPFVIAGFNVTMGIFELLGFGWKNPGKSTGKNPGTQLKLVSLLFPTGNPDHVDIAIGASHEMFSLLMVNVSKRWKEIAKNYLDFPTVIEKAMNDFEATIQQFTNLEDLILFNKRHLS